MSRLHEDGQVLGGLLPSDWEQLGRSRGAVKRLRGFESVNNLLRTLLLPVGCGWSLRETAVQAKLAGIAEVSDVTLRNRLRQAEAWLQGLCQQWGKDEGVNLAPALKGRPVGVSAEGRRMAGRVCGLRKSEQAMAKAQRKLTRRQQPGKGPATEEVRQYACYVLVFTTLLVRPATPRQVLDSYRLRWQIAWTFKRLKSLAPWGHVPKQDDHNRRAGGFGKRLVALLSQKLAGVGSAISPGGYPLPEETAHPQSMA